MLEHRYTVHVDSAANDRMCDHVLFLAQVSVSAAERLHDVLGEAIHALENCPKMCPPYLSKLPTSAELHYKLFAGRYRMVFEIIGSAVHIYDIQDCRQDTDKNLV